jgi:hypothetical protein
MFRSLFFRYLPADDSAVGREARVAQFHLGGDSFSPKFRRLSLPPGVSPKCVEVAESTMVSKRAFGETVEVVMNE